MGWNIPPTFNPGQVVSDTDLNNYLRDNPLFLLSGRACVTKLVSSSYSINNTTFTDKDVTNFSITTNITTGRVLLMYLGSRINAAKEFTTR